MNYISLFTWDFIWLYPILSPRKKNDGWTPYWNYKGFGLGLRNPKDRVFPFFSKIINRSETFRACVTKNTCFILWINESFFVDKNLINVNFFSHKIRCRWFSTNWSNLHFCRCRNGGWLNFWRTCQPISRHESTHPTGCNLNKRSMLRAIMFLYERDWIFILFQLWYIIYYIWSSVTWSSVRYMLRLGTRETFSRPFRLHVPTHEHTQEQPDFPPNNSIYIMTPWGPIYNANLEKKL